jgi:hypothetical protein
MHESALFLTLQNSGRIADMLCLLTIKVNHVRSIVLAFQQFTIITLNHLKINHVTHSFLQQKIINLKERKQTKSHITKKYITENNILLL